MMKTTASRLAAAFLGYVTLVILLLTLNPFYIIRPEEFHIAWTATRGDQLANVLLFLPIGFLLRLTGGKRRGAIVIGAAISLGIETVQLFMPARTTSIIDFLYNTLGAGMGAFLYDWVATRTAIPWRVVGQLRLETPLMGVVYLMMPLLWVNRMALNVSPSRWGLTVLLGICGAIVFGELARQWLASRSQQAGYAALTTGIWFLLGSGPGLLHPYSTMAMGASLMVFSACLPLLPRNSTDRRYERETLKRLLPFFLIYLFLMAIWPPNRPWGPWHGMFGFTTRLTDTSLQGLYPRVEYLTAFAVFGYLMAEWRGRDELPLLRDLPRLFLLTAISTAGLEFLTGFQTGLGASFIRGTLAVPSALFGGMIYHLLRAHIRFLLARSREIEHRRYKILAQTVI
ncbi:MAG TPA: VanZ family protein [Anaerolineales bacterium]|nr:VanZ family protein [Anaerolineales bacterium]